jgi:hypothetical protein
VASGKASKEEKMAKTESTLTRHDLEAKIVKRCWEDAAFRKEFTADPAGVFVKYLEVPAASVPKIIIHQEEPGFWHIVLPAKPADANELSEKDLEKIAGGSAVSMWTRPLVASIAGSGISGSAIITLEEVGW